MLFCVTLVGEIRRLMRKFETNFSNNKLEVSRDPNIIDLRALGGQCFYCLSNWFRQSLVLHYILQEGPKVPKCPKRGIFERLVRLS